VRACEEREMGSICGGRRDAETRKSVSKALCDGGDLAGLMRRRIGDRWPVTSARSTSFCFASARAMFQPIGMPIAPKLCVETGRG
jgi:hypothetical protein